MLYIKPYNDLKGVSLKVYKAIKANLSFRADLTNYRSYNTTILTLHQKHTLITYTFTVYTITFIIFTFNFTKLL